MFEKIIEELTNNKEIYFKVKAIPGAAKTEVREEMADGTFKIAVSARPEKGEANKELIDFLAEALGLRKYQVEITGGLTSRNKLVKISR